MSKSTDPSSPPPASRDPWKVAFVLVVVIAVLALIFPKPERVDPAPLDPIAADLPAGFTPTAISAVSDTRCLKRGQPHPQQNCRLMGVEGAQKIDLFVRWDFTELLRHRQRGFAVKLAYIDLIENHEEHYTGAVEGVVLTEANTFLVTSPVMVQGGRVDNRTLRLPTEGTSAPLSAQVEQWLNEPASNHGIMLRVDPEAQSSVDEFTPVIRFAYQLVEPSQGE